MERIEKEINDSGIDYNGMTDDEFWGFICRESEQEKTTFSPSQNIEEDEPF